MARYRMEGGNVVDTEKASRVWSEAKDFDGRNFISRATGGQWNHQSLYRSRKGRYYVESWSDWQGSTASCEWVSHQEAFRWLLHNGHDIPSELEQYREEVEE